MHERRHEPELADVAVGVLPDPPVEGWFEQIEKLRAPDVAFDTGVELEDLPTGRRALELRIVGKVADPPFGLDQRPFVGDVPPEQPGVPRRRRNEAEQRPDRRRLPRSVGPEVAEYFTLLDREGDVVVGEHLPVRLREPPELDRSHGRGITTGGIVVGVRRRTGRIVDSRSTGTATDPGRVASVTPRGVPPPFDPRRKSSSKKLIFHTRNILWLLDIEKE